jgi:hypothetical protein
MIVRTCTHYGEQAIGFDLLLVFRTSANAPNPRKQRLTFG